MWKTDWGMQYSLGGNFHLKRLIVSKLSDSGSYNKTLSFIKDDYESQIHGEHSAAYKKALDDVQQLDVFLRNMNLDIDLKKE